MPSSHRCLRLPTLTFPRSCIAVIGHVRVLLGYAVDDAPAGAHPFLASHATDDTVIVCFQECGNADKAPLWISLSLSVWYGEFREIGVFLAAFLFLRSNSFGMSSWRRGRDSNPRYPFGYAGFQDRSHQPLGHLSGCCIRLTNHGQVQNSSRAPTISLHQGLRGLLPWR
jgi:hypothetical protein